MLSLSHLNSSDCQGVLCMDVASDLAPPPPAEYKPISTRPFLPCFADSSEACCHTKIMFSLFFFPGTSSFYEVRRLWYCMPGPGTKSCIGGADQFWCIATSADHSPLSASRLNGRSLAPAKLLPAWSNSSLPRSGLSVLSWLLSRGQENRPG